MADELDPKDAEGLTPEEQEKLGIKPEAKKDEPEQPQETEAEKVDKRIKGILGDLQEERKRRQELELKLRELELAKQQFEEQLIDAGKEDEPTFKDDDVPTVRGVKKVAEDVTTPIKQQMEALRGELTAYKISLSEQKAINEYSADKVGADLEYNKVINEGYVEMLKVNPAYKAVVLNSPNPAEEAYRIGLNHPKFKDIILKREAEKMLEKINTNTDKTKVPAGGGGGKVKVNLQNLSVKDLMKLSDEELDRMARESENA